MSGVNINRHWTIVIGHWETENSEQITEVRGARTEDRIEASLVTCHWERVTNKAEKIDMRYRISETRLETIPAIAGEAVRPGDSIPIRLIRPLRPFSDSS